MSSQVAGFQTDQYLVAIPEYEGPLDLLLDLIERAELDITKLAIAAVTDQYLAHLQSLEERDPGEVSAFLVMAARLVQIKSEALLPRPPDQHPDEEDLGEHLAQQLIVYRRFKQIAQWLSGREEANLQTFLRLATTPPPEGKADLTGLTVDDLLDAIRTVYAPQIARPLLSTVVSIPLVTIRNKIHSILRTLKKNGPTNFRQLLGNKRSRVDVVVTFLAMLELVKRQLIQTEQQALFSDIQLTPLSDWKETEEISFDLGD
jgi:segregation and condensation protein A